MRILVSIAAVLFLTTSSFAACYGTGNLKTCYDNSGNSYSISKFGNTTVTNGYNSSEGSNWSQSSTTFGNTTLHNGQAANGNTWNSTQQNFGGMTTFNGTDSRGNSFSSTCTTFGCD